jgi:hypothetical protein
MAGSVNCDVRRCPGLRDLSYETRGECPAVGSLSEIVDSGTVFLLDRTSSILLSHIRSPVVAMVKLG